MIDRCSSRRTQKKRDLELGGGLESGDGGGYVIENEEQEKGLGERWQNTLRSAARSSKLVVKNLEKSSASPSRSTLHFIPEEICFSRFSDSWKHPP